MSLNVIIAVDQNYGIGKNGKLPWYIKDELNVFREKTLDSVLIMGRKTLEKLPKLDRRTLFCITKSINLKFNNDAVFGFADFEDAFNQARSLNKNIFIAGGNQLYDYIFTNYKKEDITLHISFIHEKYDCDTYFNSHHLKNFYILEETKYEKFTHCVMKYNKYGEYQYLDLIKDIIENGERRKTRNAETISDFCKHLKFDLRDGFPLLTTKKMFLKGIIEELLFFIRGDTNSKILEEKGVNIWKGNTNRDFLDANGFKDRKEGEMGPMYGSIWRNFNSLSSEKEKIILKDTRSLKFNYIAYNKDEMSYTTDTIESIDFNIDQLKFVINEIKTNPTSRRIIMTTFNPAQVHQGVLWPCHSITIQFYVQDEYLDMFCYNRSSDAFLGLPFNIASSSLFLMIISELTKLKPRYFNLSLGDAHIYSDHIEAIKEQIERRPYIFPTLILPDFKTLEEVEKLTYEDFKLIEYQSYPSIKAKMIA
jgi:dihydrofolate reductase/thymidylate synthase